MGVRGLTSFIAKNSDRYFDVFELHDCSLIVDANSLASLLYNLYAKCVCAFGGDYDKYANCVASFFNSLKKSGVKPLVVFDGGYETRKLKTVMKRLRDKIRLAKTITPISSKNQFFPLLMKDVFKDVLLELNIPFAQCFFEADDEIAAIARQLNCPVLSYDSDFFVYDVFYIPFPSLDIKPLRRRANPVQNSDYFISCKIYNVENFLSHFGGLKKSMVPLIATLLGNDYMDRRTFKRFFASLKRGKRGASSATQQRITALLRWLQQREDVDTAVENVVSYLKKEYRLKIATKIRRTVAAYTQCSSDLLPILGLSSDTVAESLLVTRHNSLLSGSFDNGSEEEEEEEQEEEVEDEEEEEEEEEVEDEEEEVEDEEEEMDGEEVGAEGEEDEEAVKVDSAYICRAQLSVEQLPIWFKDLFRRGFLPSYFIDMLTLHTYFCTPQIEDYLYSSSHEISLPILTVIYSLIASAQRKVKPLTYYSRNARHQPEKRLLTPVDDVYPTLAGLGDMSITEKRAILMASLRLSAEDSSSINCFPAEWRMFIACVVSWGRTCCKPAISNCHIHSVLFAVIALSVVDGNAGYHRTKVSKVFASQVGKIMEARKLASSVTKENQRPEFTLEESLANVSREDCIVLAERIFPFHQVDDKLRGNLKLYSVTTVHAFAQLQSILYHAIHLNALLNFPLPQCRAAKFFSGTFVYNAYANFKKRADITCYINQILQPGPSVSELYKKLSRSVFELLADVNVLQRKGKKHRKRTQGKKTFDADDEPVQMADEEKEVYCDVNNKFYALEMLSENV